MDKEFMYGYTIFDSQYLFTILDMVMKYWVVCGVWCGDEGTLVAKAFHFGQYLKKVVFLPLRQITFK